MLNPLKWILLSSITQKAAAGAEQPPFNFLIQALSALAQISDFSSLISFKYSNPFPF